MGWSAIESARLIDSSVAAVNSALQRARTTLEERLPVGLPRLSAATSEEQLAVLDRYVRAWESTDVDGFTALLREDAVMSMPPWRQWYQGRHAIATFFARTGRPGGHAPFRLVPAAANRQPAFAFYSRWQSPEWRFHSIQLLDFQGRRDRPDDEFCHAGPCYRVRSARRPANRRKSPGAAHLISDTSSRSLLSGRPRQSSLLRIGTRSGW